MKPLNTVAAIGLGLGAIFGLIGTVVSDQTVRAASWAIDSVGLVVATSLLAVKFFHKGRDFAAAGFLTFAIGEAVMLSGTASALEASVPAFAAGTALWSAALVLTSVPEGFAGWIRIVAVVGAVLFAITSARIFLGERILPITSPLPFFAYPFLVLTFIGWIWTLLTEKEAVASRVAA
jgi:hypothetical protein